MLHHTLITGTGRAGTTFLVELLTYLGLDTGYKYGDIKLDKASNAGLERRRVTKCSPYIIKSPWFCDNIEKLLKRDDVKIDYIFVPIRNLEAAAQSRKNVVERSNSMAKPSQISGGLWGTNNMDNLLEQQTILLKRFYRLCLYWSVSENTLILLQYPRFVKDSLYLFQKLEPILKEIGWEQFSASFEEVVRPDLITSLNKKDV